MIVPFIVPFDIPDCTFGPYHLLLSAQLKLAVYDITQTAQIISIYCLLLSYC